jgi:conjugal transfer pilus assembly protein TraW
MPAIVEILRATVLTLLCALCLHAMAARAAALGPTYPIVEPDMIEEMKRKLEAEQRSGALQKKLEDSRQRAVASIQNPPAVAGLSRALRRRTSYFDPTLIIHQDIVGPDGTVFARRGQQVNPLDQVAWSKTWLFIDARDPDQVREAKRFLGETGVAAKVVLVGGSYRDTAKLLERYVYYDQAGAYTRKFGITTVPATVRQEGRRLRIDEFPPREL